MMAIELRGACLSYGSVPAVSDVDLDVPTGQVVALLGPNGAGKSSLVAMLLGLVAPDRGTVRIAGRTPEAAVRAGTIAGMLQSAGLMPGVTVAELVDLAARAYPAPMPVGQALAAAGLTGLTRRRVDKLSGGQAQRVRFALAAVASPDTMLLDEPTTAMDIAARRDFWEAIRAHARLGRTVVFATHHLDEVEEQADRVVMMAAGRIVADGTPAGIRAAAGTGVVRFTIESGAVIPPLLGDALVRGSQVVVRTSDPDATVRALTASGVGWRDLQVAPASLDEAFLQLTGDGSGMPLADPRPRAIPAMQSSLDNQIEPQGVAS